MKNVWRDAAMTFCSCHFVTVYKMCINLPAYLFYERHQSSKTSFRTKVPVALGCGEVPDERRCCLSCSLTFDVQLYSKALASYLHVFSARTSPELGYKLKSLYLFCYIISFLTKMWIPRAFWSRPSTCISVSKYNFDHRPPITIIHSHFGLSWCRRQRYLRYTADRTLRLWAAIKLLALKWCSTLWSHFQVVRQTPNEVVCMEW